MDNVYYTAYGVAVKHGFQGTEEEWLESLKGQDGQSVDLRMNGKKLEIKRGDAPWETLVELTGEVQPEPTEQKVSPQDIDTTGASEGAVLQVSGGRAVFRVQTTQKSPLYRLTGVGIGDSQSTSAHGDWPTILAQKTGCTITMDAVSSTAMAYNATLEAGGKISFVNRWQNLPAVADFVLVKGGTNDKNAENKLGAWNSTDRSTIYGSLNEIIPGLIEKYPGKPVIMITPTQSQNAYKDMVCNPSGVLAGTSADTSSVGRQLIAQAIIEKARQYGAYVIDVYNEAGISGLTCSYDGTALHLLPGFYEREADFILVKLEEIMRSRKPGDTGGGNEEEEEPGEDPQPTEWTDITGEILSSWALAPESNANAGKPMELNTSSFPNHRLTGYISLAGYTTLRITGYATGKYGKYSFFDAGKDLMSCEYDTGTSGTASNFGPMELEIPVNAAYVVVAGSAASGRNLPKVEAK